MESKYYILTEDQGGIEEKYIITQLNEEYVLVEKNGVVVVEKISNIILDLVGLIPVIGEPADVINAISYAKQGQYLDSALSLISVIPGIGDAVGKGGKLLARTAKAGSNTAKVARGARISSIYIKRLLKMLSKYSRQIKIAFNAIKRIPELNPHAEKIEAAYNNFVSQAQQMPVDQQDQQQAQQAQAQQQAV